MRSKYLILLIVLMGLTWLVWKQWGENIHGEPEVGVQRDSVVKEVSEKVSDSIGLKVDSEAVKVAEDTVGSSPQQDDVFDDFVAQFDERRYSDDIQVEVASVFIEYLACANDFFGWQFKDGTLSEAQQQLKTEVNTYCKKMEQTYPMLADSFFKNLDDKVFNQKALDGLMYLAERIHEQVDVRELNQRLLDFIQESHRQRNGQFLSMVRFVAGYRNDAFLFEAETLGGVDITYLRALRRIALTRLSCGFQEGHTCSRIGQFMLEQCARDIHTCGMTFEKWYQDYTTPAVKADVELLLGLYQN